MDRHGQGGKKRHSQALRRPFRGHHIKTCSVSVRIRLAGNTWPVNDLMDSGDIQALLLTLRLALVVTGLLFAIGTPLAWWLSRTGSRWKGPINAVVSLPLA